MRSNPPAPRATFVTRRFPASRYALIGGVLLYIGILILAPLVAIFQGAFAEGIGAFFTALNDPEVWRAFWLSIVLALGAVALNGVFGLAIAWVLVRQNFRGRTIINGLIDLPFAVSPVIAGYMLILLFGRTGWFADWVAATGFRIVFALPGMFLVTVFVSLPFVVREVMPVLEEIGTDAEKAAYTLGASGWTTFRRVTLPSIQWGLLYGLTLTLARALGEFGAVLVVGGAVQGVTETATLFIFRSMEERLYVGAYAASLVLGVLSFIILIGMETLRRRNEV
jgi:sulfate transport system permease protein